MQAPKNLLFRLVLSSLFFSCTAEYLNWKKIYIHYSYPATFAKHAEFSIVNVNDTIVKYDCIGYSVYQFNETSNLETQEKSPTTLEYFVLQKKDSSGFHFVDHRMIRIVGKANVDSFLRLHCYEFASIEQPDTSLYTFNGSASEESVMEESYSLKKNTGSDYPDSIRLRFCKACSFVPFSISPKLDSIKKLKLVGYRGILNRRRIDSLSVEIPRRVIVIEYHPGEVRKKDIHFLKTLIEATTCL